MYEHDKEIIQYVMKALEEGISTSEIKQEVARLSHDESPLRLPMPTQH